MASLGACNLILYIHVLISFWQLSKQCIRWPVSPDRIAGSGIDPLSYSFLWSYPLTICYFSNDRRLKFKFFNAYQISRVHKPHFKYFDFKLTSDAKIQPAFTCLTFLTIVTRWSPSKSNFYAPIGKNLTGEFMRKIYAASGNLFTDSWSWQSFVQSWDVFNCLFLLDVQNEIQLLSRFFWTSWLVCLLRFWLRNAPLVKVIGNPISDGIVFKNELTHLPLFEA